MIALENVLARETEGLPVGIPIPGGLALFHALKHVHKVAIATTDTKESARRWLDQNGVTGIPYLLTPKDPEADYVGLRLEQMRQLRRLDVDLALVVDADPRVAKAALHEGITSLLFTHPRYARPEFRPDARQGIRAWQDIESEVEHENERRKTDVRLDADVAGQFE